MFLLCFACHQLLCLFLSLLLTFPIFIIFPEYSPLPTVVHLSMAQISPSPSTTPTLSNPPGHETQKPALDFNVMVIGAAMLCALVCALGLNSTLRCAFQCMRGALAETAQWAVSRRVNSGMKKKEMLALPTSTYANQESPSRASGCAICLADFTEGDKIRVLPKCNHRFHVLCIDKWLLSHSSCPTCRHWLKSSDSIDRLADAL